MTVGSFQEATESGNQRTISIWTGSKSNIPTGWVACDGNNGTPDLTDRFVKGVDSIGNLDVTGGASSKTISQSQLPSHNHSLSSSATSDHKHGIGLDKNGDAASYREAHTGNGRNVSTSTDGDHTHTVSSGSVGSGSSIENRPKWYGTLYIMKL